jgi:Flp pilus assembly protein CpaB
LERYVVASHALGIGTRIAVADLRTTELHVPAGALRTRVFADPRALVGSIVVAPIADGELIQASAVLARDSAADLRQISVPIEAARSLGDRLQAGEFVDVVATFGTGGDAFTVAVVHAARVVGRDSNGGTLGDKKGQVVVLAVTTADDAIAIAHAVAAGQVSLVRVSGTTGDAGEPPAPYRAPRPSR